MPYFELTNILRDGQNNMNHIVGIWQYILIHEKGKYALEPSVYWPISLLNCDQKILAKALANHLSKVIGTIIHMDQSGFIPNHNSSDTIRQLANLQHLVYDSNHPTWPLTV